MRPSNTLPLPLCLVIAVGFCVSADAQLSTYAPPGDLRGDPVSQRDKISQDTQEARWKFGPVRVEPELSLRNLSYLTDVFSGSDEPETSDLTATISAGLQAYIPLGGKTTAVAYYLPQYVWWQKLEDRRRFNDRFGGGIFAYFNRLTLEVSARSDENQRFVSSEFEQAIVTKEDDLRFGAEVALRNSMWLFSSFYSTDYRHLVEETEDSRTAPFDRLDRDEELLEVGFRLRLKSDWFFKLGVEVSEAIFRNPDNDLSNSGTTPFLEVDFNRGGRQLYLRLNQRDLEGEPGSKFLELDETTGSFQVGFEPRSRLTLISYGRRSVTYSIGDGFVYSIDDRLGAAAKMSFGRRTSLEIYAETGDSDYTASQLLGPDRKDEYQGYGARLEFRLRPNSTFRLGAAETDFDSSIAEFDRSFTRLTANLTFGGSSWP
ncbi:MAG: hypothetical protein K0U98_03370 [Deltaproteobacteria bacterium]|nr:hypothetical protein [Deltaproteobacteria bacterium]